MKVLIFIFHKFSPGNPNTPDNYAVGAGIIIPVLIVLAIIAFIVYFKGIRYAPFNHQALEETCNNFHVKRHTHNKLLRSQAI